MGQIIPINSIQNINGVVMASSRQIADNFGKLHKDVLRAIKNLECSDDFNQRNFAPVEYSDAKGEKRPAFNITRDGFSFLVMGFTGKDAAEWKEKYIEAFNAMEAALVAPTPQTFSEALRLAADKHEECLKLETENAKLFPKAEALDRIATANGSLCLRDAAKVLQVQERKFIGWLHANDWIYKRFGTSWIGYSDKLKCQYLEHKITTIERNDGSTKVTEQVRVTPSGLTALSKKLGDLDLAA